MVSAIGIIVSLLTSIVGIFMYKVNEVKLIQKSLNLQLLISTALMLIGLWIIAPLNLPHNWLQEIPGGESHEAHWSYPAACVTMG